MLEMPLITLSFSPFSPAPLYFRYFAGCFRFHMSAMLRCFDFRHAAMRRLRQLLLLSCYAAGFVRRALLRHDCRVTFRSALMLYFPPRYDADAMLASAFTTYMLITEMLCRCCHAAADAICHYAIRLMSRCCMLLPLAA